MKKDAALPVIPFVTTVLFPQYGHVTRPDGDQNRRLQWLHEVELDTKRLRFGFLSSRSGSRFDSVIALHPIRLLAGRQNRLHEQILRCISHNLGHWISADFGVDIDPFVSCMIQSWL